MKVIKIMLLSIFIMGCTEKEVNAQSSTEKIKDYLDKVEDIGFHGSVLVAQNGNVLWTDGYGFSNRETKKENTKETVFDIGSITKQFTGAAILKLEMQGKLSVNDKLSKYIPNLPKEKQSITLHHLLTHSAGFPGGIGGDYSTISTEDFIKEALETKLLFTPGTAFEYSNVGYSFLGIIIEKVSGMNYEDYLFQNLWKPAGMLQTGYQRPNFKDVATGYRNDILWGKPTDKKWATDGPFWHLKANGGVLSTVTDMYKWHTALLGDKILNEQAKKKYYARHIEEGEGAGTYYGYGWALFPTPRKTYLIAHNGGNGVFFADMWRYLTEDITIIFMSNALDRKLESISSNIAGILLTPNFEPRLPEAGKNSQSIVSGDQADKVIETFIQTIKSSDQKDWERYINQNATNDFRNMVPMKRHLKFFSEFHQELAQSKPVEVRINGNSINTVLKNDDDLTQVTFDLVKDKNGALKIAGLLVD